MSTEVASTRLRREILREIDREASTRGISRSVYLAELIEQRALDGSGNGSDQLEAMTRALASELREIRESHRSLAQGLREIRAALESGEPPAAVEAKSPLIERLTFSAFFSEALIKRVECRAVPQSQRAQSGGPRGSGSGRRRSEAVARPRAGESRPEGGIVNRASATFA